MSEFAEPYVISKEWTPARLSLWNPRICEVRPKLPESPKYTPPMPIEQTWAAKYGPVIAFHAREVRARMLEIARKDESELELALKAEHCTLMHYPPLSATRDKVLEKLWTRILAGESAVLGKFVDGIPEKVTFGLYFEYHPVRVANMLSSLIKALGGAGYSSGYLPPVSTPIVLRHPVFAAACPFSPQISLEIERRAEDVVRQLVWTIRRMMSAHMLIPDVEKQTRLTSVRAVFCLTVLEHYKEIVAANGDHLPFIACIRDVHNMNVMLGARDIAAIDIQREHAMCFECLAVNADANKRRRIDSVRYFIEEDAKARRTEAGIGFYPGMDKMFALIASGKKTRFSEVVIHVHSTISYEFVSTEHYDCPGYRHLDMIELDENLVLGEFDAPTAEVTGRASVADVKWCIANKDLSPDLTKIDAMVKKYKKKTIKGAIKVEDKAIEEIKKRKVVQFYESLLDIFKSDVSTKEEFVKAIDLLRSEAPGLDFVYLLNEYAFARLTPSVEDPVKERSVCLVTRSFSGHKERAEAPTKLYASKTSVALDPTPDNIFELARVAFDNEKSEDDDELTKNLDAFFSLFAKYIELQHVKFRDMKTYKELFVDGDPLALQNKDLLFKIITGALTNPAIPKGYAVEYFPLSIYYFPQPLEILERYGFKCNHAYKSFERIMDGKINSVGDLDFIINMKYQEALSTWTDNGKENDFHAIAKTYRDIQLPTGLAESTFSALTGLFGNTTPKISAKVYKPEDVDPIIYYFDYSVLNETLMRAQMIERTCLSIKSWALDQWKNGKKDKIVVDLRIAISKCMRYWSTKKNPDEYPFVRSGVVSLLSMHNVLHYKNSSAKSFRPHVFDKELTDFLSRK